MIKDSQVWDKAQSHWKSIFLVETESVAHQHEQGNKKGGERKSSATSTAAVLVTTAEAL